MIYGLLYELSRVSELGLRGGEFGLRVRESRFGLHKVCDSFARFVVPYGSLDPEP